MKVRVDVNVMKNYGTGEIYAELCRMYKQGTSKSTDKKNENKIIDI